MIQKLIITAFFIVLLSSKITIANPSPADEYYQKHLVSEGTPSESYYQNNILRAGPPGGPGGEEEGDNTGTGVLPLGEISIPGVVLMILATIIYKGKRMNQVK